MSNLENLKQIKRLGIMGGSFNPPHIGHFLMAETAMNALELEKVLFIPNGRIVYKEEANRASGTDRYEMLKTVISQNSKFCISDIEISKNGITYTADTLTAIHEILPQTRLYFTVGADSLDYMQKWYKPDIIFGLCTVVVIKRSGISEKRFNDKIDYLKNEFGADIVKVDMPYVDISSTMLRNRIKAGESIRYMCDSKIIDYISKNNLYKDKGTN